MLENIQKSLSQDFRNLARLHSLECPRSRLDAVMQLIRYGSVSELTEIHKAFSTSLASAPTGGEVFDCPKGQLWLGTPELIRTVRQAFGFFSRLHANVTEEQKLLQLREAADRLGREAQIDLEPSEVEEVRRFIRRILGPAPSLLNLRFRHGPGAVATRERGLQKLYFKETYQSVDTLLGMDSEILFRLPNQPSRVMVRAIPTTRVIAVPKDATKIRTISCEPLSMQFLQQGIMTHIYSRFARVAADMFPLTDQERPKRFARLGSCPETRGQRAQPCTIDLSNASDDVKCAHVRLFFPPDWQDLLLSVRSEFAHFEELGFDVELKTFAPMGAATCYPVESLVFAGISYAAAKKEYRRSDNVRLYTCNGDDLVVPAYSFYRTVDMLERAAFSVNVSKCCGPTVRFREACGGDYYDGVDVTYVRPRFLPKFGHRSANVPTVQLANGLNTRQFRITAQLLANTVHTPVAIGEGDAYASPDLNWPCPGKYRYERWYQRLEQQAMVEIPCHAMPLGAVDGWEPLYNWFTSGWDTETSFPTRTRSRLTWLPSGNEVPDAPLSRGQGRRLPQGW
jgi:hypothetical protein